MAQRIYKEKPKRRRRTTTSADEDVAVPGRESTTLEDARAAVAAAGRFLASTR